MTRRLSTLIVLVAALVATPLVAMGSVEVSVSDLIGSAPDFNGQEVTIQGELIGDYGYRADGSVWAQLDDDPYVEAPIMEGGSPVGSNIGVGIRIPGDLAQGLDPPGRYRNRGPVVSVTGVWEYHDPQREEESYLQVESLRVVEGGRAYEQGPNWLVLGLGLGLILLTIALLPRRKAKE